MSKLAIFDLIWARNEKAVRDLLARDLAQVNARDDEGATPLHVAALIGEHGIAEALLDCNADPNARDGRFGATPAGWAIEYLRERGCLLGIEIDDLKLAIERGETAWVERWLERLPELKSARDQDGKPLKELAAESGNPAIAGLF